MNRVTIPHLHWSDRWEWCRLRWAETCAMLVSKWKRGGRVSDLASAAHYARLHEAALQRWMAAKNREGWTLPSSRSR